MRPRLRDNLIHTSYLRGVGDVGYPGQMAEADIYQQLVDAGVPVEYLTALRAGGRDPFKQYLVAEIERRGTEHALGGTYDLNTFSFEQLYKARDVAGVSKKELVAYGVEMYEKSGFNPLMASLNAQQQQRPKNIYEALSRAQQ